jgi:hypothetical protein
LPGWNSSMSVPYSCASWYVRARSMPASQKHHVAHRHAAPRISGAAHARAAPPRSKHTTTWCGRRTPPRACMSLLCDCCWCWLVFQSLATRESGAEIVTASCYDERHPPEAILDT